MSTVGDDPPQPRRDGYITWSDLCRRYGRQTPTSFDTRRRAEAFPWSIARHGIETMLAILEATGKAGWDA